MTGKRPNLEKLRIFGCPVTVHKPGRRRSKLVQNVYNGIFLRFANTFETSKYIDTTSKRVKYARIQGDRFDEAHFTMKDPSVGGQALQKAGYPQTKRVPAARLPITITEQEASSPPNRKLLVKLINENALPPVRSTDGSVGYDLFSCEQYEIASGEQKIINTGVSIQLPVGTYGRVAPRSGMTVDNQVTVIARVIYPDYRGRIKKYFTIMETKRSILILNKK